MEQQEIKPFKMKVNPAQSEIVQRELLERGYEWTSGRKLITNTGEPFFYFDEGCMSFGNMTRNFNEDTSPEITFEEFVTKYLTNKKAMENTLVIRKDKVLEAASKCSTAKAVFTVLFPEVFEENKYFDLSKFTRFPFSQEASQSAGFTTNSFFQVRAEGPYAEKGFYLSNQYNWELVKEADDTLCLVPTKKK